MTRALRELGEDKLLAQIFPRLNRNSRVVIGAGDDCAVVKFRGAKDWLLLKTDCVVEEVHFTRETNARSVGWKAMMRALSDFAAMSGIPEFALITLAAAGKKKASWVAQLYAGLNRAAAHFDVAIVGGETSETAGPTVIVVSVAGFVERRRCILRSGGKANDDLFVTGRLGGSFRERHLNFVPRVDEARWLTANFKVHAMMDLSDGLGTDLPRLARASKLGFAIDQRALPLSRGCTIQQAIAEGEDYELLFAISPRDRTRLEKMWRKKFPRLPLTRIGKLNRQLTAVRLGLISRFDKLKALSQSKGNQQLPSGYVHFRQRR
ncbi:MAG: thiamine-monophosphate kinase [Verrucomicrobia bacterium]|nr:MAG: thiamine-monophosphate kinase [Verrucomicrobiota bacterium]